jgi:hypothetical protein
MTLRPEKLYQGYIEDFTIDNLGNVYTINRDNQLKKFNQNGDSIAVYNNIRRYGKIYSLDAANPLKLLLYYKDFGTIVILDRFLNIRNTIDLRKLNIFQVKAIGQSYDNNIWIYDEQEAKLKKLDDSGNILTESADFRLIMETAPSPVTIVDHNRLVNIYDPGSGLFVFDYFGTLKNKIALLDWQDVQVVNGIIFGRKKTTLQQYQPGTLTLKEQSYTKMLDGVSKIKISIHSLYCLCNGILQVYSF